MKREESTLLTKNAIVREHVANKEYKKALQICKEWNYKDPTHRRILRLGYDCLVHPQFYEKLGIDTEAAYQDAVRVLIEVYRS